MNIKLLKKIRKRWDWYINTNEYPVLIDHLKKTANVIDIEYALNWKDCKTLEEVHLEVSPQEWCWRIMKDTMLKPYNLGYNSWIYKTAVRRSKVKNRNKNAKLTTNSSPFA